MKKVSKLVIYSQLAMRNRSLAKAENSSKKSPSFLESF